jgi:hypothetical protein
MNEDAMGFANKVAILLSRKVRFFASRPNNHFKFVPKCPPLKTH